MSYDIECTAQKGSFPDAKKDAVIQIACICKNHGEKDPFVRTVFNLHSCAPIPGTDVKCFESEEELLKEFRNFVKMIDPDILTGYNVQNFDMPYLIDRAEALTINEFPKLGKLNNE